MQIKAELHSSMPMHAEVAKHGSRGTRNYLMESVQVFTEYTRSASMLAQFSHFSVDVPLFLPEKIEDLTDKTLFDWWPCAFFNIPLPGLQQAFANKCSMPTIKM